MQLTQSKNDALHFNFGSGRAIYLQLAEKLELLIASGAFEAGEKMPSVRELSLLTKVNPNTVQKALAILEDKNLISTDRTNGKFVTRDVELIKITKLVFAKKVADSFLSSMEQLGFSSRETIKFLKQKESYEKF